MLINTTYRAHRLGMRREVALPRHHGRRLCDLPVRLVGRPQVSFTRKSPKPKPQASWESNLCFAVSPTATGAILLVLTSTDPLGVEAWSPFHNPLGATKGAPSGVSFFLV